MYLLGAFFKGAENFSGKFKGSEEIPKNSRDVKIFTSLAFKGSKLKDSL